MTLPATKAHAGTQVRPFTSSCPGGLSPRPTYTPRQGRPLGRKGARAGPSDRAGVRQQESLRGFWGPQIHPDAWALLEFSQTHTCLSLGTWVTFSSARERSWGRGNLLAEATSWNRPIPLLWAHLGTLHITLYGHCWPLSSCNVAGLH